MNNNNGCAVLGGGVGGGGGAAVVGGVVPGGGAGPGGGCGTTLPAQMGGVPVSAVQTSPVDQDQPDPDNIKMFVGQVPRSMDENDLRHMFEEFGRVHTVNVLRDKATGHSKGKLHRVVDSWFWVGRVMSSMEIVSSVVMLDQKSPSRDPLVPPIEY